MIHWFNESLAINDGKSQHASKQVRRGRELFWLWHLKCEKCVAIALFLLNSFGCLVKYSMIFEMITLDSN